MAVASVANSSASRAMWYSTCGPTLVRNRTSAHGATRHFDRSTASFRTKGVCVRADQAPALPWWLEWQCGLGRVGEQRRRQLQKLQLPPPLLQPLLHKTVYVLRTRQLSFHPLPLLMLRPRCRCRFLHHRRLRLNGISRLEHRPEWRTAPPAVQQVLMAVVGVAPNPFVSPRHIPNTPQLVDSTQLPHRLDDLSTRMIIVLLPPPHPHPTLHPITRAQPISVWTVAAASNRDWKIPHLQPWRQQVSRVSMPAPKYLNMVQCVFHAHRINLLHFFITVSLSLHLFFALQILPSASVLLY